MFFFGNRLIEWEMVGITQEIVKILPEMLQKNWDNDILLRIIIYLHILPV